MQILKYQHNFKMGRTFFFSRKNITNRRIRKTMWWAHTKVSMSRNFLRKLRNFLAGSTWFAESFASILSWVSISDSIWFFTAKDWEFWYWELWFDEDFFFFLLDFFAAFSIKEGASWTESGKPGIFGGPIRALWSKVSIFMLKIPPFPPPPLLEKPEIIK